MAIRQIRVLGDDVLRKKCKEVKEMTPRMHTLVEEIQCMKQWVLVLQHLRWES